MANTPRDEQRERLCVFSRYPEPGKTKTRLIPALGARSAARLQHAMTTHILSVASEVAAQRELSVEVRFDGGTEALMRDAFGDAFAFCLQGTGNLGERMQRCMAEGFSFGIDRLVIVGADVPAIDADNLSRAFESLREHDVVIGPALDGGYYLIGLRRPIAGVFEGIEWGAETVCADTLCRCEEMGLNVHQLPILSDVDRPEDLALMRADKRFAHLQRAAIPVDNRPKTITMCMKHSTSGDET
jgi:uncharacterized protein